MRQIILIFALVLIAITQSACATFKSEETLRAEYLQKEQERRSKLTPDELKDEDDKRAAMSDCVSKTNLYAGRTPVAHKEFYAICMHHKGY